jgi:hypothetical protein
MKNLPCPIWALDELEQLSVDLNLTQVDHVMHIMSAPEGVLIAFLTELVITCR